MLRKEFVLAALIAIAGAASARAEVVISSDPTSNMSCSGGVCAPTAKDAVLNVTDLENLLASGNATVTTTGSGVQAKDIKIKAGFGWSSTSTLSLDAYRSISVSEAITISGLGGLVLATNDGVRRGSLVFDKRGNATCADLASTLT